MKKRRSTLPIPIYFRCFPRRWDSLLLLLLIFTAALSAQTAEFGVSGGILNVNGVDLGVLSSANPIVVDDQRLRIDNGWSLGFRVTLNITRWTGHEIFYRYNRTELTYSPLGVSQGMAIHQGGYGYLLYLTPETVRVRPFVTGGGHFSNFVPPGQSAQSGGGSTKLGGHYGAGVKFRIRPNWLVRFDARDYIQGKPFSLQGTSGSIHLLEFSAGVSFIL